MSYHKSEKAQPLVRSNGGLFRSIFIDLFILNRHHRKLSRGILYRVPIHGGIAKHVTSALRASYLCEEDLPGIAGRIYNKRYLIGEKRDDEVRAGEEVEVEVCFRRLVIRSAENFWNNC